MGKDELDPATVQGVKYLRKVFSLLERLQESGCQRDSAGNRQLLFSHYAGLVLLSLFNPTLQSLHGLSELSRLRKVQKLLGGPRVSVGSLSESVRVFDPALLAEIFQELWQQLPDNSRRSSHGSIPDELLRRLTAVDGSALRALSQLVAAASDSRAGKWRMHLQFEVWRNVPEHVVVTPDEVGGDADERSVLSQTLRPGRMYVMDRGYERYALFEQIVQQNSDYLCRVQHRPVEVLEQRLVSAEAAAAGVLSDEIVVLGRSRNEVGQITHAVRRIVIAGPGPQRQRTDRKAAETITLLTNQLETPPECLAAVYRLRWSIEIFFRFLKHVLGCRHLLSHKPEGIAIQVYCALIAALLLSQAMGQSVGRRGFQLVSLYLQGWAEEDEVLDGLRRLAGAGRKKDR
jgi:hypothetical protein